MSLLIDGHNLIGALPSIELGARDDEQQLIVRLRAYHGFSGKAPVSYTHLRAHETVLDLVCRLLLEKKNKY